MFLVSLDILAFRKFFSRILRYLKIMETRHILNYRNEWWRNSTFLLQLWYIIWYILYTLYKDYIHILCIIINHVNGTHIYIYIDNNTAYNVLCHHCVRTYVSIHMVYPYALYNAYFASPCSSFADRMMMMMTETPMMLLGQVVRSVKSSQNLTVSHLWALFN